MLGALTRINIFLQHCFWELSVYITCIKGKRADEVKKKPEDESWMYPEAMKSDQLPIPRLFAYWAMGLDSHGTTHLEVTVGMSIGADLQVSIVYNVHELLTFWEFPFQAEKNPSKLLIVVWHVEPWELSSGDSFGFCLTAPTNLKYQNPLQSRISGCSNGFDPLCKSVWTDIFLCCSLFSTLISNLSPNLFYVPVLPWWWQHVLI